MTAGRARTVEYASLALGRRLGQGGQGAVHQVLNRRINEAEDNWEVVYKEYGATVLPGLDGGALAAMVDLLDELNDAERRWLCEKTAWPAAVVRLQGLTSGFLMRAAPDRFHFRYRSLSDPTATTARLANLEYLLNDDAYVALVGLTVSERDRLLLLADLAATLSRLHRIGIAVGDLSPKNLLFTTAGRPECFLIDCDAMRLRGATVLPQAETPDWQLPAGEERATPAGDVYKLALLAVRLFARDQIATDPAALYAISPALGELARSSLAADPAGRPAPAVWAERLTAAAATAPPVPAAAPAAPGPVATGPGAPGTGPSGPGTAGQNRSVPPAAVGVGIVAAIAVILALVFANTGGRSDTANQASPASPTYQWTAPTTPYPPPERPSHTYTPAPSPSPTPPDPVETATVGDCFEDNGTATVADLRSVDCGPGAYEVVRIFNGTTDLDSCKNVTASDESVSYRRYQRVLCLSYQSPAGNAYHAQAGDCVYGPNGPGVWHTTNCATGNFKVLATYRGAGDGAKCDGLRNYNQWKIQTGPNRDSDRLLCLSMNYPDDAGYATLNECLLKSGSDEKAVFTNVGSCAGSNVVVTGRSGTYDDEAFCQGYGWTTWRPNEYPKLAYTTCWRWK